jgi:hypothetical protein
MTNERKYQNRTIGCCVIEYSATTAELFKTAKAKAPFKQQVLRVVCRANEVCSVMAEMVQHETRLNTPATQAVVLLCSFSAYCSLVAISLVEIFHSTFHRKPYTSFIL